MKIFLTFNKKAKKIEKININNFYIKLKSVY